MVYKNVLFSKRLNGYDVKEVERYIKTLADEYQAAYEQYKSLEATHIGLLEENKSLVGELERYKKNIGTNLKIHSGIPETQGKDINNTVDEAGKAMRDIQIASQRIIKEANCKKAEAIIQAEKTIEQANSEASEIKEWAKKIVDEANAEAVLTKEWALKVISNAKNEAKEIENRAKDNLRRTNEKIAILIGKYKELITFEPPVKQSENNSNLSFIRSFDTAAAGN